MNKKLIAVSLLIPLIFQSQQASAKPAVDPLTQIEVKSLNKEAQILSDYLAVHNSPLQYHAQDFIDAAKEYDLDWKLLPSIAGVESTFGKQIPGGYNAWGWGVYGTQAIYFSSWKDGIFEVARGLRENYLDKGLNDPYAINKVYAASPRWGNKVTFFMKDLDNFSKVAALSGQLNLR